MSATVLSPKQLIIPMLQQMTISEQQFQVFNANIDGKLAQGIGQAKDATSQPELNRISQLYKQAMEGHKANLQTQYDLGKKMIQQVETEEDLAKIGPILQEFQTAMQPLLETHKKLQAEITDLEGRIISLLPMGTQFFT